VEFASGCWENARKRLEGWVAAGSSTNEHPTPLPVGFGPRLLFLAGVRRQLDRRRFDDPGSVPVTIVPRGKLAADRDGRKARPRRHPPARQHPGCTPSPLGRNTVDKRTQLPFPDAESAATTIRVVGRYRVAIRPPGRFPDAEGVGSAVAGDFRHFRRCGRGQAAPVRRPVAGRLGGIIRKRPSNSALRIRFSGWPVALAGSTVFTSPSLLNVKSAGGRVPKETAQPNAPRARAGDVEKVPRIPRIMVARRRGALGRVICPKNRPEGVFHRIMG
jgi:hypothetical protein